MVKKQTKIVATISDLMCDVDHIKALYEAGVNVVRLNTAHQKEDDTLKVIKSVRAVSDKLALLLDTKGPEVRTANIEAPIEVTEGETIRIYKDAVPAGQKGFQTNYDGFVKEVAVGARVLIDDGETGMMVTGKGEGYLELKIGNSGKIKNRKSINAPDTSLTLPSITEKDRNYIKFAADNDLDFVAHSFVRNKQDVLDVQAILDQYNSKAKIIAKIENMEGVKNIDEILDVAYGVMVARGDLGIEVPAEEVPVYQKMMIRKCIARGKPVITATQMLQTMISNPRPTRAEATDVANAVLDGTDAVMLSAETASGQYPFEAVEHMHKIISTIEAKRTKPFVDRKMMLDPNFGIANAIGESAGVAAAVVGAGKIICLTDSGYTAKTVSHFRPPRPILAISPSDKALRQLALYWGVWGIPISTFGDNIDDAVRQVTSLLKNGGFVKKDEKVVFTAALPFTAHKDTNMIRIEQVP